LFRLFYLSAFQPRKGLFFGSFPRKAFDRISTSDEISKTIPDQRAIIMNRKRILSLMHGHHQDDVEKKSDQQNGIPLPHAEKSASSTTLIRLPQPLKIKIKKPHITDCILNRKSTRRFDDSPLSLDEIAYLLWATQGIKSRGNDKRHAHHAVKRTVPSAGSRHPFETYLVVQNVIGLKNGIYRYAASVNSLAIVQDSSVPKAAISKAVCGQVFCAKAPVFFIWTAIPYRTEWRYGIELAMKAILLDAGHVGQKLHIACEALGLGTCMIGAYFQELVDKIVKVDGQEEFSIYMAPVGKAVK
jgi:SagB-type dehydrogenase family enzyme